MAANGYDGLCEEIYEQIYERLERRDEETLRFAPRGTAKKVLHVNNLLRFFRSLLIPGRTAMDQFGLAEEDLAARINSRHLHDFLAILIFATCGIEAARTFATRLVAEGDDAEWPAADGGGNTVRALPASREGLVTLFGNVVTADKFFSKQACFCPVVIRKREEFRVQDLEAQRLPYLAETRLGKGSFGEVFKVRIAKGHFYDPQAKAANVEPAEMARKDYLTSLEFTAGEEREIMEQILNSPARTCENILENYGSLEIGTGVTKTYSLFMPLAICDLRAYMMDHHKARPNTIRGRASIILSAQGLAGGLNFLHTQMKTSDMDDLVCYHMDLKPSNILVFRDTRNGETRNIWKVSDFGMARVKIRRRGQDGDRERNFDSWFVRRQRPQDPSLSATLNRRGEGTYLAPESLSSTRSMKAESDVWSLGCIISVVFAYLEEGSKGVERYQDARMVHPHADLYDRFFLRGRFSRTKTHPVVNRWHTHLIDKANQRDPAEGEVVKTMLRYLEDRVFEIDQSKRRGAKDVERMLVETFRAYKALSETGSTPNLGETQSKPHDQSIWLKMLSR
jgi:serine/threonine protein kinase